MFLEIENTINYKANGRFHMGYISISDWTNSKIRHRSCRQHSEGAYMENRGTVGTVTFNCKFIKLRHFVGVKQTALNYDRERLLKYHQQQRESVASHSKLVPLLVSPSSSSTHASSAGWILFVLGTEYTLPS